MTALSDDEIDRIMLNLNFDMVGSPNFVRFVYDGDGSATAAAGPPGSGKIEGLPGLLRGPRAADEGDGVRRTLGLRAVHRRGIPAGGLFSGAEGIKTDGEASVYGGTAGEAVRSCYHQACDHVSGQSQRDRARSDVQCHRPCGVPLRKPGPLSSLHL